MDAGGKEEEKVSMKHAADGVGAASVASEDAEVKVPVPFYRRRSCHICCGITTAVLLALVILILILSFTVFKTKDPRIKLTGMSIRSFSYNMDPSLGSLRLDVSLHLNVSVKNPNVASFKYQNSSTLLFYRGKEVGKASIPAGKVEARKTAKFTSDLEIHAKDIAFDANLTSDIQAGTVPVTTYASIRGRLNVINIFKRHAVSTTECTANIFISNTTLKDFHCDYSLKL